jgi:vesicle-fusing ATPase
MVSSPSLSLGRCLGWSFLVQNFLLLPRDGCSGGGVVGVLAASSLRHLPTTTTTTTTTTRRRPSSTSSVAFATSSSPRRLSRGDSAARGDPRPRRRVARRLPRPPSATAFGRDATTTIVDGPPASGIEVENDDDDGSNSNPDDDGGDEDDPFALLSSLAATALLQSDRRRDAVVGKDEEGWGQGSSATNWIDEGSAFAFRKALDKVRLYLPGSSGEDDDDDGRGSGSGRREERDEAIAWLRWMRSVPSPVIIDLSPEARLAANGTVSDDFLRLLDGRSDGSNDGGGGSDDDAVVVVVAANNDGGGRRMRRTRAEFMDRIRCRLILLPSGRGLRGGDLYEPAGSLTFAKLLYGGVTRYRILPSSSGGGGIGPPRRAGEKTERKTSARERVPSWVQYGGAERRYDAVDMGPAMVLEYTLLPKIQGGKSDTLGDNSDDDGRGGGGDMTLRRLAWRPRDMFRYVVDDDEEANRSAVDDRGGWTSSSSSSSSLLQGKDRNDAFASDFRSRVGGLGRQIDNIVRRVLDGRVLRPAEVDEDGNLLSYGDARGRGAGGGSGDDDGALSSLDDASRRLSLAALEAEELALLGLTPVRGLLLYGPPGCGKTALAREIARALRARAPKIVSAPELLDRWVGGSERLVRELFHDAEAELASVNGDASRSALHVIVIDEIDAVFRKRSSAEDSGEATRSSTVNQILSKLDGVKSIPNVLLIGMTNRRELLDEALLRPGRLEVQIEIPLPDREGRREILNIHFGALRNRGRLSQPLCGAIDGTYDRDVSDGGAVTTTMERGRKRRALKKTTKDVFDYLYPVRKAAFDLAHDSVTGGFSGADLEGLVRCAGSIALSRAREEGAGIESLLITLDDVKQALTEVKV